MFAKQCKIPYMKRKIKFLLLIMLIGLSLGCGNGPINHDPTATPEPVEKTATSSATFTATVTTTTTPVGTEDANEEAVSVPVIMTNCVTVIGPGNNVVIPSIGKTTFSWSPMELAASYVLEIIMPSGTVVPFNTDQTSFPLYMESFSPAGIYQWRVIAFDNQGSELCTSEPFSFGKEYYEPPADTPEPSENKPVNGDIPTAVEPEYPD